MSSYADSDLARVWQDGDAWRAPSETAFPDDEIFSDDDLPVAWKAFGGIKAGFQIKTDQNIKKIDIFNNTTGAPYKLIKDPPEPSIAMRPVDYSKATMLTLLRGGSVAETTTGSGVWQVIRGDSEQFALIILVKDGDHRKAIYVPKAELANIPETNLGDKEDVEGFDLEVSPLAPSTGAAVQEYLDFNPLV